MIQSNVGIDDVQQNITVWPLYRGLFVSWILLEMQIGNAEKEAWVHSVRELCDQGLDVKAYVLVGNQ